jgi:hypothetical protein
VEKKFLNQNHIQLTPSLHASGWFFINEKPPFVMTKGGQENRKRKEQVGEEVAGGEMGNGECWDSSQCTPLLLQRNQIPTYIIILITHISSRPYPPLPNTCYTVLNYP